MRISDWSSDVCSSDLVQNHIARPTARPDTDFSGNVGHDGEVAFSELRRRYPPDGTKVRAGCNLLAAVHSVPAIVEPSVSAGVAALLLAAPADCLHGSIGLPAAVRARGSNLRVNVLRAPRSEERRVGQECVRTC